MQDIDCQTNAQYLKYLNELKLTKFMGGSNPTHSDEKSSIKILGSYSPDRLHVRINLVLYTFQWEVVRNQKYLTH